MTKSNNDVCLYILYSNCKSISYKFCSYKRQWSYNDQILQKIPKMFQKPTEDK